MPAKIVFFSHIYIEDDDYSGSLITANAFPNACFGFSCGNVIPYVHIKTEHAPLIDLFITDNEQTDNRHRYTGIFTGYEWDTGIRFKDFIRIFYTKIQTVFAFNLGKETMIFTPQNYIVFALEF